MMKNTLLLAVLCLYSILLRAQTVSPISVSTENYQLVIKSAANVPLQNISYRIDKNLNGSFADENTAAYDVPFNLNFFRLLAGTYGIEIAATLNGASVKTVEKIDIIYPVMPSKIYTVVGKTLDLFFDNVILTNDIGQYSFTVDGPSGGVTSANKWSFTPTAGQNGIYDFKIVVRNTVTSRVAVTLTSKLYVAQADAGAGKEISTVLMGHSYITSYVLPPVLYADFLTGANNPKVTQCGSRADNFYQNIGVIHHEGQEATNWATFSKPILTPLNRANPFWESTTNSVSMKTYVTKYCNGKTPDYFMVLMDLNDVCWLTYNGDMNKVETEIDKVLVDAENFLNKLISEAPNMKIGVMMMPPFAKFLDNTRAYGYNTGNQVRQIEHRIIQKWMEKYDKKANSNLSLIPTHLDLDRTTNYDPAAFARTGDFHPVREGYVRMARSNYSWIKNNLAGLVNYTDPVVISSPVVVEMKTTEPTCIQPKGQLTALVSGGTPPYTFKWSSGQNTATIRDLSPQSYSVTVTDANQNQKIETATIVLPTLPTVTVTTNPQTSATSPNGSAQLVILGNSPYTVTWSNGASGVAIRGVSAGTYTATVKDVNGCSVQKTAIIENKITTNSNPNPTPAPNTNCPSMLVSIAVVNNKCGSITSGSASVVRVTGGTAPYSLKWSTGSSNTEITNLKSGNYTATITDKNGCATQKTIVVTNTSSMNITYRTQNASSATATDGQITATVTGGLPPYNIVWSNNKTGVSLLSVAKGCYTATITDANSCTVTKNICVEAGSSSTPTNPTPTTCTFNSYIYTKDIICNKDNNGLIEIFPSNSAATYTYKWSHDASATSAKIFSLKAGNYTVTMTDNRNCTSVKTLTINEPAQMEVTLDARNTANATSNDGSVVATGKGGTKPYFFSWGSGLPYVPASTNVITNVHIGNYTITVSDMNGCRTTNSFSIQNSLLATRSQDDARSLILYPNPAESVLQIENTDAKDPVTSVDVFSFEGIRQASFKNLASNNPLHTMIDVSDLPEGWYFVQIRTAIKATVRKVLILRQ
jgi:Secretion system C-terminal sorting domain/SprB repeat